LVLGAVEPTHRKAGAANPGYHGNVAVSTQRKPLPLSSIIQRGANRKIKDFII
jgi:hypothetical protein